MRLLIDRLPFGSVPVGATLPVPLGDPIPLQKDRIVVWVSVAEFEWDDLPRHAPRFPAILDTGFNDGFLMQAQQLMSWASPGTYERCHRSDVVLRVHGEAIPVYYANVWIHPNVPGRIDPMPQGVPFRLELPVGIALTPAGSRNAKALPLLGTLAIRFSEMLVQIDGGKELVNIQVP